MAIGTGPISARRATAAEWTAENPVLAANQFGFERDTGKYKVGDGTKAWSALAYAPFAAQGVAVADSVAAPTKSEFGALLTSLRNAGLIAT